jgi:D-alanyl-D-alanine carboxypeptidase (penicillin-binding protein 5/6)
MDGTAAHGPNGTAQTAEPDGAGPPAAAGDAERRLGIRVITTIIGLCAAVLVTAVLTTPRTRPTDPPPAAANPQRLVQTIAPTYTFAGTARALPWPAAGQAAVDVAGIGRLGTSGPVDTAVPIASVTKTMTAYVILADHPLEEGGSGPTITVTAAEAAAYAKEFAQGDSLVLVKAGEQLTERQALDALMLASADNVAWILARWDAGSSAAFATRMNSAATSLGMKHTVYTDPSGLDPATVSTATDQIKLGEAAMESAVFRQIVAQTSATVPVQGKIDTYNRLVGHHGIDGIKTGSTSGAGGCLLFSATATVGGRQVTIIGAVLGQSLPASGFLNPTLSAADKLISATQAALVSATIADPRTKVAVVRQSGLPDQPFGVASPVDIVGWAGLRYQISVVSGGSRPLLAATSTGAASPTATAPLDTITPVSARSGE